MKIHFKEIKNNNLEFNFNLLFKINDKNKFEYENDIKDFINYYITNDNTINKYESINYRIKKIYDIYKQE